MVMLPNKSCSHELSSATTVNNTTINIHHLITQTTSIKSISASGFINQHDIPRKQTGENYNIKFDGCMTLLAFKPAGAYQQKINAKIMKMKMVQCMYEIAIKTRTCSYTTLQDQKKEECERKNSTEFILKIKSQLHLK